MSDPVNYYTFSTGIVDISVYATDLRSAKLLALISCELMTRQLDRELDREGSEFLIKMRPVTPVETREAA
jgi:hypothetical protein